MNPSWWKGGAVLGLVALAYLAGRYQAPDAESADAARASGASSVSGEKAFSESRTGRQTKSDRQVSGFKSAVPFAPGGAREWFMTKGRENCEDSFTGLLQLIQNCATLDERAAEELAVELREILKLYHAGDPEMRAAFNGDDLQERGLAATVFRLSQLNPQAALRFLQESPDIDRRGEMLEMVFANAALKDPAEAKALLSGLDDKMLRGAMEGVMGTLTGKNPQAAFDLLSSFTQADLDGERRKFVEKITKDDPAQAIQYARSLVQSWRDPRLIGSVVDDWMRTDPEAARAFGESYRGPGEARVKGILIKHAAESDPRQAAEAFAALGAEASNMGDTGIIVAKKYVEADLPGARAWIDSLPAGQAKDLATQELVDRWVKSEPLAAADWIDKMPAGTQRNDASIKLINSIRMRYPQEALDWASSLPDEKQRATMQQHVIEGWKEVDPEAAEAAGKKL